MKEKQKASLLLWIFFARRFGICLRVSKGKLKEIITKKINLIGFKMRS
jgi:hypothetical protein